MKMVQLHRIPTVATIILLLVLQPALEAKKSKRVICPVGFRIAYSSLKGDLICYRLKGPEKLTDTYVGCSGNLYTSKLYNSLNLTKSDLVLWTEYKSLYPGGPFIDYSFTKSIGSLVETSFEISNPHRSVDEELCVVMDPVSNFTTAKCDEEYYRYCLVHPYVEADDMSTEGCEKFNDSYRFWSPKSTCLSAATAVGGGTVRATWNQSKEICEKRGGTLLYNGWRYSNNPLLHISSDQYPAYPLGITYDPQRHMNIVSGDTTEPPTTWHLDEHFKMMGGNETSFGAVKNDLWELVNSSYIFYDVICEKNVELKRANLVVSADDQNKLILTVAEKVNEDNIYCFTDSESYSPTTVKISSDGVHNKLYTYILKPIGDGYYWCVHIDSKRYQVSESNKALWVREETSLQNNYAVKLVLDKEYTFDNLDRLKKSWEKKLKAYIFFSTRYYKTNGGAEVTEDPKVFEDTLFTFKREHPDLNPTKEKDIIYEIKLKKVFLDKKTILIHIHLNPNMLPVQPGTWEGLQIVYMKPIYYCKADNHEFVESITVQCRIHTCIGNFNDGVQVVTTMDDGCIMSTKLPTLYRNQVPPPYNVTTPGNITSSTASIPTTTFATNNTTECSDYCATPTTNEDSSDSSEETPPESTTMNNPDIISSTSSPTFTPTASVTFVTMAPETIRTETPIITTMMTTTTEVVTSPPPPPPPPTTTIPTTLAPEDQLQQVINDLDNLINSEPTSPVSVDEINTAFDQVDGLLAENLELNIPGELLHLLDGIGTRLDLAGSENATTIRDNIALVVAQAEAEQPVKGLRIVARDIDNFTSDTFQIIRDRVDSSTLQTDSSEVVVKLPDSVAASSRRISFVVFRNDRAFHASPTNEYRVSSRVLSINVENVTEFERGESVDLHFSSLISPERNTSRSCAFWVFEDNGKGYWSQEGCTFIRASRRGMLDTCRCTHLTHFAEVLIPRAVFSEANEQALEIISVIGCCLSMLGVILVGITAVLFRSWRRDFNNKIWLQLCIAVLLLVICFLIAVYVRFDNYGFACMLVGVLMHYSVLASFCWMLVAAIISYRRLVMVFSRDASHKLLRASAFSWGAPCAIVGILLSVDPRSYAGRFEEKTPTGAFCYPSGLSLWLAVYAPIAVMLLANWTLFILIVRSVYASRRIQRHGDSNEALRCASVSCLLVFMFGLPWIFGLFAFNLVLAYLFALTATFQGFVLFMFFVVGNKKTRDLWFNKLRIKQTRKIPVTSSTYTNRSTAAGARGAPQTSVEAKVSKPKSLASSDDSRFS